MSIIPFKEVKLGEICNFYLGLTYTPKYVEKGIPFLSVKDLKKDKISFKNIKYISEKEFEESTSNAKPKKGDILFGRVGTLGNPIIIDFDTPFCIFVSLGFIRVHENISNGFIKHWISSSYFMKQVDSQVAGSAQKNLNVGWLKNFKLSLPPLEEQKKIADILSTVDQKIAFVEDNISQTEELKKGLMQKLLTEGIGHTEFKDSEVGRIPDSWEVTTLRDIAKINKAKYTPNENEIIDYIGLEHINEAQGTLNGIGSSNETLSTKNKFNKGDILFGKLRPYLRKYYLANFNGVCSTEILVFTANENIFNKFLFNLIQTDSFIEHSVSKVFGTKMPRTSWDILKEYIIPLPPLKEQKQIEEILSTVDQKLEVLKDKKESFEELKKGLMQKLLTGEVRV